MCPSLVEYNILRSPQYLSDTITVFGRVIGGGSRGKQTSSIQHRECITFAHVCFSEDKQNCMTHYQL